ncbi:MAG: c-type cytochrome biogenesis protein CcsB [Nitrospirae bacterium]|nr:c-type cytochrome biogenesis protein CcsB [Nitrospirota bacterium]
MSNITFFIALALYMLSSGCFIFSIGKDSKWLLRAGLISSLLGIGFHSFSLVVIGIQGGHIPITNLFEALSFLSWSLVLLFLISYLKYRSKALAGFALPLATIILLPAAFSSRAFQELPPFWQNWWLGLHGMSILLAYGAFGLAFISAIMYLLQERQLKIKSPGLLYRWLPSLERLEEINHKAITIGFAFLTFGIIIGLVWARKAQSTGWSWGGKETWTVITWLVYALLLHRRITSNLRGRKIAYLCILGFGLVLFTFIGVSLLFPGLHSFVGK